MKITNLTSKTLKVKLRDAFTGVEYEVFIAPERSTQRDGAFLVNADSLKGLIAIDDKMPESKVETKVIETTIEEPKPLEEVDTSEDAGVNEESSESSEFICELCGAEFASSRGLASHMKRVHPESNN